MLGDIIPGEDCPFSLNEIEDKKKTEEKLCLSNLKTSQDFKEKQYIVEFVGEENEEKKQKKPQKEEENFDGSKHKKRKRWMSMMQCSSTKLVEREDELQEPQSPSFSFSSSFSKTLKKSREDTRGTRPSPKSKKRKQTFWEEKDLNFANRIILSSHRRFLENNPDKFKIIVDIIQQRHIVTLRLLEHLITNFAKNYHVVLKENFILKHQYKRHLPKKHIDPNRRGPRIKLNHLGEEVITTIPQLTCLRWVTTSPILEYAEKHAEVIKKDVNVRKGLIPMKKDTSHIQIPICLHPNYICNISFFSGYESKKVDEEDLYEQTAYRRLKAAPPTSDPLRGACRPPLSPQALS